MADINQDITRMIVEMRELGKLPAPCKGGSHNNLLRYNKLRDRILDKFLSAFDEVYRLKNSNRPPERGGHLMDVEKLIEQLNGYFEGKELGRGVALDAATALSMLQAENEKLQKMHQEEKVICHETQLELERMKKIMRENRIMIISSKYPGSTARWNIQKPRDQKEEL